MDWPGVRQIPEGSGEQRKMEETGCEIICGAPTALMVKGVTMMITHTLVPNLLLLSRLGKGEYAQFTFV